MAKTVSAFRGASVIKYSSFDMIIFLHNFLLLSESTSIASVIGIMFSQIVPVVKTIPGKLEESALPVLTLRIGLPCTGRYARLSSDLIIPFYKIQKVNSLLGHTSYGRIHNVQPAQER